MWDTFRAAHPLYTILVPERVDDFVNSLLDEADQQGFLPIWPLWGKDSSGRWVEPFDPNRFGGAAGFTEGKAWQYTWHVLHDVAGLAAAMGGAARAVERLERLFTAVRRPRLKALQAAFVV